MENNISSNISFPIQNSSQLLTYNDISFLCDNNSKISVKNNSYLVIKNLKNNSKIEIDVLKGIKCCLSILSVNQIDDFELIINLSEYSEIECFFADFSLNVCKIKVQINFNGKHSFAHWRISSLCTNNDQKNIDISAIHNSSFSKAYCESFGVCKGNCKLTFSGISHIINKSIKSETRQDSKILVFDKESIGIAKPILKIDENDVNAGHGTVVGKISDEHMFYLQSRGLSENEARELITFGYLKPILKGFIDEDVTNQISKLIESRV